MVPENMVLLVSTIFCLLAHLIAPPLKSSHSLSFLSLLTEHFLRSILEIENVHPQCAACNMWGMKHGSAAQEYTLWMEDMYGRDFVEEMIEKKSTPVKRYKADYEEILAGFHKLIEFHEKRIA